MKLRRLLIRNYRGIKTLDWRLNGNLIFLAGAGDSTKTTILDALTLVLSSRYNVTVTDVDFYQCDTSSAIAVQAVITDLPESLLRDDRQGWNLCGIRTDGQLEHEPLDEADVQPCLIVEVRVDRSLEPVWSSVKPGGEKPARITATERAALGHFRLGESSDTHLRWTRGSALTAMTSSRADTANALTEAQRGARSAVFALNPGPLHDAADIAGRRARELGSSPFIELRPGLDPRVISGPGSLILHDGQIPLTSFGTGSRRLTSLAIQEDATADQSIVAIDEIEHGLEPHRIAHLVRSLRHRAETGQTQVIFTSHSPVTVENLTPYDLYIVTSRDGETHVRAAAAGLTHDDTELLQKTMRARPSALLARTLIVGEGPTEVGVLRALLEHWDGERREPHNFTSTTTGVSVVDGAGDAQAPDRAMTLANLGYKVALLMDSDTAGSAASALRAQETGVKVVRWADGHALEDAIVAAFSTDALQELVELAAEETSEEGVLATVSRGLDGQEVAQRLDVDAWVASHGAEAVRQAISAAAKGKATLAGDKKDRKSWFKREDRAFRLGELIASHRTELTGTDFATKLREVRDFSYRDADELCAKAERSVNASKV